VTNYDHHPCTVHHPYPGSIPCREPIIFHETHIHRCQWISLEELAGRESPYAIEIFLDIANRIASYRNPPTIILRSSMIKHATMSLRAMRKKSQWIQYGSKSMVQPELKTTNQATRPSWLTHHIFTFLRNLAFTSLEPHQSGSTNGASPKSFSEVACCVWSTEQNAF